MTHVKPAAAVCYHQMGSLRSPVHRGRAHHGQRPNQEIAMAEDTDTDFEALKADVAKLRSDLSDLTSVVRQRAGEAGQAAAQEIAKRPMVSVLTAFGVGFLVGLILGRRD